MSFFLGFKYSLLYFWVLKKKISIPYLFMHHAGNAPELSTVGTQSSFPLAMNGSGGDSG